MSTPQSPAIPAVKPEHTSSEPRNGDPAGAMALPSEPPSSAAAPALYTITIPSCSGWFSWEEIHETERRLLPEFFDGKSSASRNPIIRRFRVNPSRKITFTDARRGLVGDVGSIRRVFDFMEEWGLVNYTPFIKPPTNSKDKKEAVAADENTDKESNHSKRICFNCKAVCSLACFTADKAGLILCERCFIRGNCRPGINSTDFKRVDFNKETRTEWTDKDTIHLLEAVVQHGEDWGKVSGHVGRKNEKECVSRFIKLPFGEQFLGPPESIEDDMQHEHDKESIGSEGDVQRSVSKRRRLTPLADSSNPIMAQVAFLSAVVGSSVADAAAHAAIRALHKVDVISGGTRGGHVATNAKEEEDQQAHSQIEKEEKDIEHRLSNIKMKEIQDKILYLEDVELLLEKERLQLQYMGDLLFADQLAFKQHKIQLASKANAGELVRPASDVI